MGSNKSKFVVDSSRITEKSSEDDCKTCQIYGKPIEKGKRHRYRINECKKQISQHCIPYTFVLKIIIITL